MYDVVVMSLIVVAAVGAIWAARDMAPERVLYNIKVPVETRDRLASLDLSNPSGPMADMGWHPFSDLDLFSATKGKESIQMVFAKDLAVSPMAPMESVSPTASMPEAKVMRARIENLEKRIRRLEEEESRRTREQLEKAAFPIERMANVN